MRIGLDEALDLTRTADVWLFRGRTLADRAVQVTTNSPVNHVGMSVVIDDLPPLMWHAELSRSLPDLWSGTRQRGAQLHDLRESVLRWATRYGHRVWLRQLDRPVTRGMEDAVLRTIARLDGTPFPSAARLASRWLLGRAPTMRRGVRDRSLETAYCARSEEHTSELQSRPHLVCRLLLEKKKKKIKKNIKEKKKKKKKKRKKKKKKK